MIETTPAPPPQCGTNRAVPVDWAILAGLRFLLALIVVGVHLARFANPNSLICRMAHLGGFTAVIGFLVVSGISMAASVERRPQGFLGRRVLRIYPLYLAAVLAPLLLFAAAACVLIALSTGVRLPTPVARVLEYLGDLSYPLYLFHFPAAAAAYVFLKWRSAIALTAAGLLAAIALHHGLDQPIKWLVRRVPQRTAARSLGGAPEDAPA